MLSRSYLGADSKDTLLSYSPMFHARLFSETAKFRDMHFQPTRGLLEKKEPQENARLWLDGNPAFDRPLFVQFCANKPDDLLEAAKYVAPYCDAVDLNLGCPQGIAKSGHYGAFLQEDPDTIYKLINKLHKELPIPVTAKIRILESKERTLEYAKMVLSAGASILTVHGRRREQKGHNMGVADLHVIRYLRDQLPAETVLFANGNILNRDDIARALEITKADGIMSAEGNLSDPTIFATAPAAGEAVREYWRGRNGQEGYRIDGVFRRYMDIIHEYVLDHEPPVRRPLWVPGDLEPFEDAEDQEPEGPPKKKQKREKDSRAISPSLRFMQGHLFQLFRPFIAIRTDVRDALAKTQADDINGYERVLKMLERATIEGIKMYENEAESQESKNGDNLPPEQESSKRTIAIYKRPWFICQPHIRPLPEEAKAKGAVTEKQKSTPKTSDRNAQNIGSTYKDVSDQSIQQTKNELPAPAAVCG